MKINEQAQNLNSVLDKECPIAVRLLSDYGKAMFFPKSGILAQAAEAKGKEINATIGQALSDDGRPLCIPCISSSSSLEEENILLYSPSYGQHELRELWLARLKERNQSIPDAISLPVVTNAITHGLSLTVKMFVNPGEKMILPDKFWGNYNLIFSHAELDTFQTFSEGAFNATGLGKKLAENPGKQVILLNFPNNPTGYSATNEDAKRITEVILKSAEAGNEILAICDDAYFGLFYEDNVFRQSLFTKLSGLHENVLAVKLDGITKEMYSWGLRVGFVTYGTKGLRPEAAKALEDKTAGAVRASISNVCTYSQYMAINALKNPALPGEEKHNFNVLKERYEEVKRILQDEKFNKSFEALPFNSGYFMCVQLKERKGEEVRKELLEKHSTGVISMSNLLRIAYSSVAKEKLEAIFENIHSVCKE